MNKMIATMIGFILLALHLSSQVEAQNTTMMPPMMNTTMNGTWTTMNGTDSLNGTRPGPTGASVSVHANTLTVLASVALAASALLHRV